MRKVAYIEDIIFMNKQNIPWAEVESYFAMPVQGSNEKESRINIYKATLVVRSSLNGLFLYDIINIKKRSE